MLESQERFHMQPVCNYPRDSVDAGGGQRNASHPQRYLASLDRRFLAETLAVSSSFFPKGLDEPLFSSRGEEGDFTLSDSNTDVEGGFFNPDHARDGYAWGEGPCGARTTTVGCERGWLWKTNLLDRQCRMGQHLLRPAPLTRVVCSTPQLTGVARPQALSESIPVDPTLGKTRQRTRLQ